MDFEICAQAPRSWKRLTIEDVCTRITSGGTPSRRNSEFFINGTIPWVKTQELQDGWIQETEEKITEEALRCSSAKLLPPNTVMLAMYGATVGQLGILRSSMTCNQACCALIVDKNIADFRYVYYLLRLHREVIKGLATGAAQQNLSAAQIKQFKFAFPDIETQTRVADALSTLDNKIDLNRRINQTLEAMAQAIFKSWFVDFDPVKAKIAAIEQGEDPLRAAMRAISGKTDAELDQMPREHHDQLAATAALFPDAMEESELGDVPKGWEVAAFGDVAVQGKGSVNPANAANQIFTHYSLPAFDVAQLPMREAGESIKSNKTPVPSNSVLVSKLNPHIPRIWLVGNAGENAICSTEFIVWEPKRPANSVFVYCLASSSEFNSAMRQLVTGTSNSHQRVKPEQITNIRVIATHNDAIRTFSESTSPLMENLLRHRLQSKTLADLRDILLPKLLSGVLSVDNLTEGNVQ